jgi:hypothetical protein
MAKKPLTPGTPCPTSGQWGIVNPTGKPVGPERTVTKGEPMPPTPKPGQGYVLNDKTKH